MTEAAYSMMVLVGALALTFVAAWFFERRESKQTIRELTVSNESLREYMNERVTELRAKLVDALDSRDAWIVQGKVAASEVSEVLDATRKSMNDARQIIVDLTNDNLEMVDALLMHDDHMARMNAAHDKHTAALSSSVESLSSHVAALKGHLQSVKVRSGQLSETINRTFQRIASEIRDAARAGEVAAV